MFKKIKGIHISEYNSNKHISDSKKIVDYLKPEFVYIPLVEGGSTCEVRVNEGDNVCVGDVIAIRLGRFSSPIHSPVSGEVLSCNKKMWHSSGKLVTCIQIKNNFKETICEGQFKVYSEITKENIRKIAKENGIVGLGGSAFPTYVKYDVNHDMDTIIINGAECEPFITGDYRLMIEETDKLIRGIKYIMKAVGAKNAVIAIKKDKIDAINAINIAIKDEKGITIHLLKNVYPAGYEKYLVQHIIKRNYKVLPGEVGCVVNNVATAVALCEAIETGKPLIEKVVTFTGYGLKNPQNVRLKIGTDISKVIEFLGGYTDEANKNYMLIAGGPMTGSCIYFDNLIVNRSLGSVLILPKKEVKETLPCMGCGKCVEYCPVNINPTLIKRALEANNTAELVKLHPDKCVQCGLCSYICPSRIDLTTSVLKAKALLRRKK